MVVFRPFASEVILAKVKSSDEDGIRCMDATSFSFTNTNCTSERRIFWRHLCTSSISTSTISLVCPVTLHSLQATHSCLQWPKWACSFLATRLRSKDTARAFGICNSGPDVHRPRGSGTGSCWGRRILRRRTWSAKSIGGCRSKTRGPARAI